MNSFREKYSISLIQKTTIFQNDKLMEFSIHNPTYQHAIRKDIFN